MAALFVFWLQWLKLGWALYCATTTMMFHTVAKSELCVSSPPLSSQINKNHVGWSTCKRL